MTELKLRKYKHTIAELREHLELRENGELWWTQQNRSRKMNKPIGCKTGAGYLNFNFDGAHYLNHVVIFALIHDRWPEQGKAIDHINGRKTDNRPENLRECTYFQNQQNRQDLTKNNRTGYTGVHWDSTLGKYGAGIKYKGKTINGGRFDDFYDAVKARIALEQKYWGNR